jgi:hypothetical protein
MKIKVRGIFVGLLLLIIWRVASASCPDSRCMKTGGSNVCCYFQTTCQQSTCSPTGGPIDTDGDGVPDAVMMLICPYVDEWYHCYRPPNCTYFQTQHNVYCPNGAACACWWVIV